MCKKTANRVVTDDRHLQIYVHLQIWTRTHRSEHAHTNDKACTHGYIATIVLPNNLPYLFCHSCSCCVGVSSLNQYFYKSVWKPLQTCNNCFLGCKTLSGILWLKDVGNMCWHVNVQPSQIILYRFPICLCLNFKHSKVRHQLAFKYYDTALFISKWSVYHPSLT